MQANLLTIGTEITSGEVVNSNAAWVSLRLEEMGVRVVNHITVRDQPDEILSALKDCTADVVVVTGGLGPTSDDVTRECMAKFCNAPLEYDAAVFADLEALYASRGLPLREAHKHQCHFPAGSERLKNPVGTALGFHMKKYFVLPGPPRELEGMWFAEVSPRLQRILPKNPRSWQRWTCLGLPESEVAELLEPVLAGRGVEVGYRATVPYVKVKIYCDPIKNADLIRGVDQVLGSSVVARDFNDLAEEFLQRWPLSELRVQDFASDGVLSQRLFGAQRELLRRQASFPKLNVRSSQLAGDLGAGGGLELRANGDGFLVTMSAGGVVVNERMSLPFKLQISTERGRRSAVEWAIWLGVKALRAANK